MIWRGRSTYRPRPRRSVPPPELIGPMLVSCMEASQQGNHVTESQDPNTLGAAEIQGTGRGKKESDLQEQSQSKTGDECGDGPDDQGKILPNSEEFKMPEGGDKQPQV
uniref:X antigen family member 3 n=1 Tax=Cercocebus atys TaxID=9531 RepID=A0A2K5KZA0_CERAT